MVLIHSVVVIVVSLLIQLNPETRMYLDHEGGNIADIRPS